jgi:hypothetical protein
MIYVYKDGYGPRGLFAYVWCVLDVIKDLQPEDSLYVDLKFDTPYFDQSYFETTNVWDYYFEQPYSLKNDVLKGEHKIIKFNYDRVQNLIFGVDDKVKKYALFSYPERQQLARELLRKHFKVKTKIQNIIDIFSQNYFLNKKVLGVHVRAGEHFTKGHAKNQSHLIDLNYYYDVIDKQLNDFDVLFLITCEEEIRKAFIDKYGEKLCFYDNKYLGNSNQIGNYFPGPNINYRHSEEKYKIGEAAVIDCLLLSLCDKKLVTCSNLGFVSVFLNDNEFQFIDEHIIYNETF